MHGDAEAGNQVSESETQSAILSYLKTQTHRLDFWRVPVAGIRMKGCRKASPLKGHPDIAGVIHGNGRYFAIEVKQPGAKMYQEQLQWGLKLQKAGALYFVANSVEDVMIELSVNKTRFMVK